MVFIASPIANPAAIKSLGMPWFGGPRERRRDIGPPLSNLIQIPRTQRSLRYQFSANAYGFGACADQVGHIREIHSSGWNHGDIGQRPLERLDVAGPAYGTQGKIFTKSLPAFHAAITSLGVSAPAMTSTPRAFEVSPWRCRGRDSR